MSASLGESPLPASPALKRKIAAILAADVVGYSRLVAQDEEATLRALAEARIIFDGWVARGGGRIFNTAGDSVMCEFDSAVEAVRSGIAIQAALAIRNEAAGPKGQLTFRMGITIGDVVERGTDLLGDGVNIAARLESIAPAGGICVSRSVHEAVANKVPVAFRSLGNRRVKNIPQAIEAFSIEPDAIRKPGAAGPAEAPAGAADIPAPRRRGGRGLLFGGIALALALGAGAPALYFAQGGRFTSGGQEGARQEASTPKDVADLPREGAKPPANEQRATPEPIPTPPPAPNRQQAAATSQPASGAAKPSAGRAGSGPDQVMASIAAIQPKTLAELYRSARFLEASGDRAGALKAYAAAAPLSGDTLDPPLRYAALLSSANGREAAERSFADLAKAVPASSTIPLAAATIGDPEQRRAKLEAYVGAHPENGPAQDLLAQALIQRRPGMPTLTERRLAFEALEAFLDAASSGTLAQHFLDKTVLEGWLETARTQRQAIETSFAGGSTRPSATFTRIASGWLAHLTLPEPALEVSTRLGERGDLQPTGTTGVIDPRTGKPTPALEVELPAIPGRRTLYVAYRDAAGHEAGPFPIAFDPAAAGVTSGRDVLERYPESWVAFRPDIPNLLSYAGLVANRCAIAKAAIGFGDEAPRRPLPLPPCDPQGAASPPSATALLSLPEGTDRVQVQLTFPDGQESQARTFQRP